MKKLLLPLYFLLLPFAASAATLINDTETERVLYALIEPLADAADIPDGRLKIHIINDNDFNAFVRGGEDVFIHSGLLTQIKSPSALQAVIAHEMGHMLGGHMIHMADRMEAEMTRAMIIQALGIGMMFAGGDPSAGAGLLAGSSGIARQSLLSFTRDEERVADDMGVDLMIDAKLDPYGFVEVLEQMQGMTGEIESRINPNNINHPLTTERLKNVKEKLKRIRNQPPAFAGVTAISNQQFDLVRAKLVGYLESPARVTDMYPSSDKSDAAIYARAIANMRGGNLAGARVGTGTLISRDSDNPYYYELLGDIEYQSGNYDTSVTAYEKSIKLIAPPARGGSARSAVGGAQIETALALVLTERNKSGDRDRAIELCKRALLTAPAPLTYWVLARAYGEDDGRGDWAMAEFYNMQNKKADLKKYAKRAQSKLKKDSPEYIKSGDLLH